MLDFVFLAIGLIVWWLVFGAECFLNGAFGGWTMPFREWYNELLWNLPIVGKNYRLDFTKGDLETAKELPGILHFIIMNIILPLTPWLLFRIIKRC